MIQCIICEDWWHASHLDSVIPANDQYSEMICKLCMTNNEFLQDYSNLAVNVETGDVDVVKVSGVNDSTVTDEKLTNGSVTKEKLVNNGIDEDAACNDMETSTTDVPNEATPSSDNDDEARSTKKECIEPEKLESEAVDKPVKAEENSTKSTDAPMETDETDKAVEVILEDSCEDKHETKNSEASANKVEDSSASVGKTEESRAVSEEKVEETSANCEENCTPTEEKRSEGNTDKSSADTPEERSETTEKPTENTDLPTTDGVETPPTESFKTDESFNQANSESNNAEDADKSPENMETSESKITEKPDSDTDAEDEEIGKESATTESLTADTEIPSAKTNDLPSTDIETSSAETNDLPSGETNNLTSTDNEIPSAETNDLPSVDTEIPSVETNDLPSTDAEIPSAETSDRCSENTTDETEAAKPSQDEEMNDISKTTENENVSDNIPAAKDNTCKADESENGDSKDDSTNKESDSNESIVPEPASIENKRKVSTEDIIDEISAKKPKLDDSKCVRPKGIRKVYKGATFWPTTFRQKLCTCNECISMYKDLSVLFLTDLEDTVFAYETLGKERTAGKPNQYEKGLEALCSLGRIQQIDALTEYNKMRDKLLTFLQSFKDRKEIVTEHDIKTFFAGMKPEKRIDGVYFCG